MKVFLFLALSLAIPIYAEDSKGEPITVERGELKVGNRTYTGAKLSLVNPLEVLIRHDSGSSRVPANLLDPALAKELGYDEAEAKAAAAEVERIAEVKRTALPIVTRRYQVHSNTEDGLIVWIYEHRERHFSVPTRQSSGGGGGGLSGKTMGWVDTGKEAWIPHTAATRNITNESIFEAKVIVTEETKRIWDNVLLPMHKVVEIIPKTP